MKKRIKHMCWAILIVVFAAVIGITVMNIGDKKAGIEGNKVGFRYPFFCVRLLMGEPDKEIRSPEVGETTYYYYDRTFFGHKGTITYNVFLFQVNRIILDINIDDNEAETLFNTISQSIESKYKDETGYYCNPIEQGENGELTQEMGTDDGACGISFSLSYLNGELELDGFDLW